MNAALKIQDMELSTELDQAALKEIIGGHGRGWGHRGRMMRRRRVLYRPCKKHYKYRPVRFVRIL
ncbi:MAG: hypothetical protein V7731_18760 [Amphritea sp.]|jgi:hypothetical protein